MTTDQKQRAIESVILSARNVETQQAQLASLLDAHLDLVHNLNAVVPDPSKVREIHFQIVRLQIDLDRAVQGLLVLPAA